MKRIFVIPVVFCLIFAACVPAGNGAKQGKATAEMQGDLEFFILHDLGLCVPDSGAFPEVGGMFGGTMCVPRRYANKLNEYGVVNGSEDLPREHVLYTITQWPDVMSGKNYITGIEITDPAVHVFGVTTRATAEEFMTAVKQFGLKEAPWENVDPAVSKSLDYARAVSPDGTWYTAIFSGEGSRTITFYAPTTNEMGVMF